MTSAHMERHLAAILAADMVGYSRAVGRDEEGTIARFAALCEELFEPVLARHRGRLVKTTGDGFLAEFASVVDSLRCAVEIQRSLAERNAGQPEDRQMVFRMGVNLGDVVAQGGDIYGDGVNIAARLEGLADPGGICIARKVQQEVAGKLDVGYEFMGEKQVKNIAPPVPAYRVLLDPALAGVLREAAATAASPRRRGLKGFGIAALLLLAVAGDHGCGLEVRAGAPAATGLGSTHGRAACGQAALHCRAAISEHVRRSQPELFCRWHRRRRDHRPFKNFRSFRDCPQ